MANIAVVGLGYVGLTTAVGMANLGHQVIGLDIDIDLVGSLRAGNLSFFEDGLKDELRKHLTQGQISFTSSYEDVPLSVGHFFVCVSTPASDSGSADISNIQKSCASISEISAPGSYLVIKSTVPIGTCRILSSTLAGSNMNVVSNPEFLSEGRALTDFINPSRIVVGAESPEIAQSAMDLYKGIDAPKVICSLESAESIKHASNSLLAIRLSFVNELAALSEVTGANIEEVLLGVGLDPRIGDKFLKPGPGWGGSCFPKDTSELTYTARKFGRPMATVEAAMESNKETTRRVVETIIAQLQGTVEGKQIAIWGLAFKANTEDVRDSPAISVIKILLEHGAKLEVYDPMARLTTLKNVSSGKSALDVCRNSDALVVLTEWEEFEKISSEDVLKLMKPSAAVFDTRRVLNPSEWKHSFPNFKALGGA